MPAPYCLNSHGWVMHSWQQRAGPDYPMCTVCTWTWGPTTDVKFVMLKFVTG